jgi:hypothetical protein
MDRFRDIQGTIIKQDQDI